MDINQVILTGRITKDFELRRGGQNNTAYGTFTIANNDFVNNQETADFFDCKVVGHNAEYVAKYLKKGSFVMVSGRLKTRTYQDKNGNNVKVVEISVKELKADVKSSDTKPVNQPERAIKANQAPIQEEISDEDLPF